MTFATQFYRWEGRANRVQFLACFAVFAVVVLAMAGLNAIVLVPNGLRVVHWLYVASALLLIVPMIRRLHDMGRSGWWILLMFVPIGNLLLLLALFVWPGVKEPNRWGTP